MTFRCLPSEMFVVDPPGRVSLFSEKNVGVHRQRFPRELSARLGCCPSFFFLFRLGLFPAKQFPPLSREQLETYFFPPDIRNVCTFSDSSFFPFLSCCPPPNLFLSPFLYFLFHFFLFETRSIRLCRTSSIKRILIPP